MNDEQESKLVTKYLFEYANVVHAQALMAINIGMQEKEDLFSKAQEIKKLAEGLIIKRTLIKGAAKDE